MNRYLRSWVNLAFIMLLVGCTGSKNSSTSSESKMLDRSVQPTPGNVPNLALPEIQNFQLSNGLSVKFVEHHELPIVNLRLVIKSGSFQDPKGKSDLVWY